MQWNGCRLTIRGDRPCEPFVSEIFGNGNGENTPLTPRKELSWLSLIGSSRINVVIRPDRNVECLFLVPIEVTDEETKTAVVVLEPAFKRAGDAGACVAKRFQGQLLLRDKRNTKGTGN